MSVTRRRWLIYTKDRTGPFPCGPPLSIMLEKRDFLVKLSCLAGKIVKHRTKGGSAVFDSSRT